MKKIHNKIFICFVFIVISIGSVLHFWNLKQVPLSLYHDEMDYVVTGEAIARYGTDLSGQWRPTQLLPLRTSNITAELPGVYQAIFQSFFGLGPDSARFPATFFGISNIILCMAIAQLLLKNKKTTLLVGVVMAINPWHVHISRSGYEAMSAVFFELCFILSVLFFIYSESKVKWKVFSVITAVVSAFLGFYSYHAAKFTVPAISIASLILIWMCQKNKRLNLFFTVSLVLVLAILCYRTFSLSRQGTYGNRQSETVFDSQNLARQVDFARREAIDLPGTSLFVNKGTMVMDSLLKHYFAVFDIHRLIVNGYEGTFQFSLIVNGFFYLSTIPMVTAGLWYMVKFKQKELLPLFFIFLVSPVASVISVGYQSIFRSSLTYSLLLIFAAVGLSTILFHFFKKNTRYTLVLQSLVYCILIGEAIVFGFRYFSQYPILSADNQYFFEKLLVGYVKRQQQPVIVVSDKYAYTYARSFIAYNGLMPMLTQQEREQFSDSNRQVYKVGQVTFTRDCPDTETMTSDALQVVELIMYENCRYNQLPSTSKSSELSIKKALGSPIDSGAYFYLYNDSTCYNQDLRSFIHNSKLSDFDVLQLPDKQFCEKWVKTE